MCTTRASVSPQRSSSGRRTKREEQCRNIRQWISPSTLCSSQIFNHCSQCSIRVNNWYTCSNQCAHIDTADATSQQLDEEDRNYIEKNSQQALIRISKVNRNRQLTILSHVSTLCICDAFFINIVEVRLKKSSRFSFVFDDMETMNISVITKTREMSCIYIDSVVWAYIGIIIFVLYVL